MSLAYDWRVYGSIIAMALILLMILVPTEATKTKRAEATLRRKRQLDCVGATPMTYAKLGINGVTARRGDTATIVTNTSNKLELVFDGISSGHYSETIFVCLSGEGVVTQYSTEALAQAAYKKGDYGIVAITMSPGTISQRSIVPEIIHESNAFSLEFSFRVIGK